MRRLEVDVMVIGAGTAGFGAAIAAGRKGLNTCLIERSYIIGGVLATAPGMPFGGGYPLNKTIGGIYEELMQSLYTLEPPAAAIRECALTEFGPEVYYDEAELYYRMHKMLDEANVNLLMDTRAIEVKKDGNNITSAICIEGLEYLEIVAKTYIDCSGDGTFSIMAGVPYQKGDDDGKMMAPSMIFTMNNVDREKAFASGEGPHYIEFTLKGAKEGKIPNDMYGMYLMKALRDDAVFFNTITIPGVDGSHPKEVTKGAAHARKRCLEVAKYVKEALPGFENAFMSGLSPTLSIRETNRLIGMHILTKEELLNATKFDDGIVCCDNPFDDVGRGGAKSTHDRIGKYGRYYRIPFSALIPKEVGNLMFAGRNLSADPMAFASVRGMPTCMAMGQACGTAAYYSINKDIKVQDINTDELISDLQLQGVAGLGEETL